MKFVPTGASSFVAACAGVVISETIDDGIPEGTVSLDQERFAERNPDIVNGEKAAIEVFDSEILCGFD